MKSTEEQRAKWREKQNKYLRSLSPDKRRELWRKYKSKLSPEKKREKERKKYARLRIRILDLLLGKCKKCGNSDYDVLQIDHIQPFKNDRSRNSAKMFRDILTGRIEKDDFQLLCANCHMKKSVMELRENKGKPSRPITFKRKIGKR